jgi:signal transduction histidine kinase
VGGWNHDIHNKLTAIVASFDSIREHLPQQTEAPLRELEEIISLVKSTTLVNNELFRCFPEKSERLSHFANELLQNPDAYEIPPDKKDDFSETLVDFSSCLSRVKSMVKEFQVDMEGRGNTFERIELSYLFDELARFSRQWSDEVSFEIQNETPDSCGLYMNSVALLRIFGNLIKNAHEAMAQNGTRPKKIKFLFTLSHEIEDLVYDPDLKSYKIGVKKLDEPMLSISISDTGGGVSPSVRETLFQEGESTKEGEGRGIGLANSVGILSDYGGRIKLANSDENGSTFLVRLPAHFQ